jgi:hypothetical protein
MIGFVLLLYTTATGLALEWLQGHDDHSHNRPPQATYLLITLPPPRKGRGFLFPKSYIFSTSSSLRLDLAVIETKIDVSTRFRRIEL